MTQGDYLTSDSQSPKGNRFIIIAVLVSIVAVVAFVILQNKKEETSDTAEKKVYTTEEKVQILQNLSSAIRIATSSQQKGVAGSLLKADGTAKPVAQVVKERTQILQNLSASLPKSTTTLSATEKLKILNSLSK